MVSTGLETTYVGARAEMTPFLIREAAVLDKTASIYGIMVPYPNLP